MLPWRRRAAAGIGGDSGWPGASPSASVQSPFALAGGKVVHNTSCTNCCSASTSGETGATGAGSGSVPAASSSRGGRLQGRMGIAGRRGSVKECRCRPEGDYGRMRCDVGVGRRPKVRRQRGRGWAAAPAVPCNRQLAWTACVNKVCVRPLTSFFFFHSCTSARPLVGSKRGAEG